MDSGYIAPGDSLDPEFDVTADLSGEELLWIMDELLRLEMLFHDGYPLSQTIYTSLHVFRLIDPGNVYPYTLEHGNRKDSKVPTPGSLTRTVLRAYCLGVIKSCDLALDLILNQTFYEEEDAVTYLFGRELCPKLKTEEAMMILTQAMSWLDTSTVDMGIRISLKERLIVRQDLLFCMNKEQDRKRNWQRLRGECKAFNTLRRSTKHSCAQTAYRRPLEFVHRSEANSG